jgi:serine/threonine protein kinase
MTLSTGTRLSHYEITFQIGKGGMGEVYQAKDQKLGRDVAIKVLPQEFAQDSGRVARFQREAKLLASLNHPNILAIFDFDTEGDVTYAVTELLEGETLREHLHKIGGPLPWKRVQGIGSWVADGLGAAHGKGVVHRDIKPSNILLCSDGRVKILDFGLAASREAMDSEAETASIEALLTREGMVMGTVGYMAPEQARGLSADHRSDIFALGCILYEMLSGKRAFPGGDRRRRAVGDPYKNSAFPERNRDRVAGRALRDRRAVPGEEPSAAFPVGSRPGLRATIAVCNCALFECGGDGSEIPWCRPPVGGGPGVRQPVCRSRAGVLLRRHGGGDH